MTEARAVREAVKEQVINPMLKGEETTLNKYYNET
jgi:hypothetical protein